MAAQRLSKSGGIFSTIDLNQYGLQSVPPERRASVKEQVGEFLVSRIKRSVRGMSSPVAGEGWKATLSKDYAKEKRAKGGGSNANLRLSGSMMNALTYKVGADGKVHVGIKRTHGPDGRPNDRKAVGHNHFEAGSSVPRRRFLPDQGQDFKGAIDKGIKDIVQSNQSIDLEEVGADVLGGGGEFEAAIGALAATLDVDDLFKL